MISMSSRHCLLRLLDKVNSDQINFHLMKEMDACLWFD